MSSAVIWQFLELFPKTPKVRISQLLKTKTPKLYPVSDIMARDRAFSIRIDIDSFTLIGTSTLSAESSIYRVSLDVLPILRPSELSPMMQKGFNQYGKVLHIGLYLDPKTKLFFFRKRYAMLDITKHANHLYRGLIHDITLGRQRVILATWIGMEKHCFCCHKPGHTKSACPRLQRQKVKSCNTCGRVEHLIHSCPRRVHL